MGVSSSISAIMLYFIKEFDKFVIEDIKNLLMFSNLSGRGHVFHLFIGNDPW